MMSIHTGSSILGIRPPEFGPVFFDGANEDRYSSTRPHKVKILVVDDESTIANTLVEILAGEGFEAVAALNGDSAVELAQTFKPNIVLSDVVIPGINGVQAGIKIRSLLPNCRVILFSGQAATLDLLREARRQGHDFEILAKPIKPETLLSIIRRKDTGSRRQ